MAALGVNISPGSERALWRRFETERDPRAREALVVVYMPMARRIAGRYAGVSEPFDDLLQVASLGLLNAIDRFDPGRGIPFAGFASPTILGELKRHFRDRVWNVRVPRPIHDLMAKIDRAVPQLTTELQRPPSFEELVDRVGVDREDVLEALAANENRRTVSIDRPPRGADGDEPTAAEWLGSEDDGYLQAETRVTIERFIPDLDDRAREAMRLRFVEDLSQSEIADRLGCSQMHVSRILRRTLEEIRQRVEAANYVMD